MQIFEWVNVSEYSMIRSKKKFNHMRLLDADKNINLLIKSQMTCKTKPFIFTAFNNNIRLKYIKFLQTSKKLNTVTVGLLLYTVGWRREFDSQCRFPSLIDDNNQERLLCVVESFLLAVPDYKCQSCTRESICTRACIHHR